MTLTLTQLRAMVKYELLMQWRRRSLPVIVLFLFFGLTIFTLISWKEPLGADGGEVLYVDDTVTPATVTMRMYATGAVETHPADETILANIPNWLRNIDLGQANATLKLATMLTMVTQLLIIMLLLMCAETIPLDKHYRVRELLDTLPLGSAAYLSGKLLAVWLGIGIGLLLCAVLYIPIAQSRMGTFDLSVYARLWLVMLLPAAIFASGLTILGAAWAATRRASVLIGLVLIPVGFFVFVLVIYAVFAPIVGTSNLVYRELSYEGLTSSMIGNIGQILLFANLGMLALGLVVWRIMRLREGK